MLRLFCVGTGAQAVSYILNSAAWWDGNGVWLAFIADLSNAVGFPCFYVGKSLVLLKAVEVANSVQHASIYSPSGNDWFTRFCHFAGTTRERLIIVGGSATLGLVYLGMTVAAGVMWAQQQVPRVRTLAAGSDILKAVMLLVMVCAFVLVMVRVRRVIGSSGLRVSKFLRVWRSTGYILVTFTMLASFEIFIAVGSWDPFIEKVLSDPHSVGVAIVAVVVIVPSQPIAALVGVWGIGTNNRDSVDLGTPMIP